MPQSRIALITGANKGLGLETGRQLARQGITVLIAGRDPARASAAADSLRREKLEAHPITLDVTDSAGIRAAADRVRADFGTLDILVNNAAVIAEPRESRPSSIPIEQLRKDFETNFFGLVEVTQAFVPMIRSSPAGRIVNLTSILGSMAEHADPCSPIHGLLTLGYNCTKAAVNMFTINLANELRSTSVKVNAAHPGWVKTDMGGPGAPMELADGARTAVWLATLDAAGPTGGFFHQQVHMRW